LVTEFVEKRQLGVVWVSFFPCGYGVFEFLDSSLRSIAEGVGFGRACFWLSVVFVVCVPACLLVWIGKERTAEAVSCSAVCTSLQAASARC